MKHSKYRLPIIAIAVVIAFLLFMNRQETTVGYRAELRSLAVQTEDNSQGFITALNQGKDIDIDNLSLYSKYYQELLDDYDLIEGLPQEAMEDYQVLVEAVHLQNDLQSQILEAAQAGEDIPAEWLLALREATESREFYESRVARY